MTAKRVEGYGTCKIHRHPGTSTRPPPAPAHAARGTPPPSTPRGAPHVPAALSVSETLREWPAARLLPTGLLLDGASAAHHNGRMNHRKLRHVAAVLLCAVVLPCRAATQTTSAPAPSTSPSIVKDSRTFELRTYYATPGKLEELHQRFRNHTIRLFKKHGMTIVGFWAPTAPADAAANTLVYVLAYPSDEAKAAAWKGFE